MQYNRRKQTRCACETLRTKERVITNRVADVLYASLMPQRQAITMFIIHCSKPQQSDAVTPTPLAHRSHSCMRARALDHDKICRGRRRQMRPLTGYGMMYRPGPELT